jgi:AraC family transcriptional regulator, transcriptional activator of pobA
MEPLITVNSIQELHDLFECGAPVHPLVSLIDYTAMRHDVIPYGSAYQSGLYTIACKRLSGNLRYGRSYYDFSAGSMMFIAPHQILAAEPDVKIEGGWELFFHPDLVSAMKMDSYSFFRYDTNEALHISEEERNILTDIANSIKREYTQRIDKHTQGLIVNNIELMLNNCNRFYDRQFITRAKVNNDIVQRFEQLLKEYFAQDTLIEQGLPDVKHFASSLHLSPNYLSDVLNKYTGKTTQEYIHLALTDKAKSLLWNTNKPISEIAYELGFEHPSHFNKIFKTRTGVTPSAYRLAQ